MVVSSVTFKDFEELQTKLVLVPWIEEEGIGAVVANCFGTDDNTHVNEGSILIGTGGGGSSSSEEEKEDVNRDLKDTEFAKILAIIREVQTPIILQFETVEDKDMKDIDLDNNENNDVVETKDEVTTKDVIGLTGNSQSEVKHRVAPQTPQRGFEEEKKVDEDIVLSTTPGSPDVDAYSSAQEDISDDEKSNTNERNNNNNKTEETTTATSLTSSFNLSSWTSRMSAAAAAAVASRAAAARAAATTNANSEETSEEEEEKYSIFVQSPTGAFLPSTDSKLAPITNSSLLVVRCSALQPAGSDCQFQWYKSCSNNDDDDDDDTWESLDGANRAAFQPTATEVGYKLRCIVQDDDTEEKIICDAMQTVSAASMLFNGARQALVRGAQFAGWKGRGNAEGRTFRIQVGMSYNTGKKKTKQSRVASAVTLFQISGTTAEPLHQEPLLCVTAASDHENGKYLELIFPFIPESASMVAALCTEEQRFLLQAPNRMARESMLLAIGIANYQGEPVNLDVTEILYKKDAPAIPVIIGGDDSSSRSSSASSSSSSVCSHGSHHSQQQQHHHTLNHPPLPTIHGQMSTETVKQNTYPRSKSLGSASNNDESSANNSAIIQSLQEELVLLREKLQRKDKVVSELQRQITHADESARIADQKFFSSQKEIRQNEQTNQNLRMSLAAAEKKIDIRNQEIDKLRKQLQADNERYSKELENQNDRIASLEKANRTLQNEKDVLAAAVEARDSKLEKMSILQTSHAELSEKVCKYDELQREFDTISKRHIDAKKETERVKSDIIDYEEKLKKSELHVKELEKQIISERARTASHKHELEKEQMKIQKLIAERNSYKQKGDSLAKEMNRVCRHGRTVREVEKILADDVTRREEVELLREQKHKAVEQVEYYRKLYEQSLAVQKLIPGFDYDYNKLLERNTELERLLSELTEYINAKEMQLETMKQVNDTLQYEIQQLAKMKFMSNNDI